MQEFLISFLNQFGYFGIAFFIAVENIFPPIPSEVILTFGGFMTLSTELSVVGVIVAATVGAVVGALVLYFVGRYFNKERLQRLISGKLGRVLHLKKEDIEKADTWFDRKGRFTVFFCRFVPIVRSLISIPAGMSEMPLPMFLILTILGTTVWNTVLVLLGKGAGDAWPTVVSWFETYSFIGLCLLVVFLFVFLGYFFYFRIFKSKKKTK